MAPDRWHGAAETPDADARGGSTITEHGERGTRAVSLRACVLAVVASACTYALFTVALAWRPLHGPGDFGYYYSAASSLVEGRSPYGEETFAYPPLLAFLVAPFTLTDLASARWLWYVLGQAAMVAAAAFLVRRIGGDRVAVVSVAIVWGIGGTIAENLVLGQINPLLLLLVVLSIPIPGRDRGLPGLAIGAATALKLWPGVLVLREWFVRRRRSLLVALAAAVALVVGPWALLVTSFVGPASPAHSGYWLGTPAVLNFSIPATVLRLLDFPATGGDLPQNWVLGNHLRYLDVPVSHGAIAGAVAVVGVLGGLALLWRAVHVRASSRPDLAVLTGGLLALALAFGPVCWYHYRLLHFAGAAALVARALRQGRRGLLAATLAALLVATWARLLVSGLYLDRFGWTAASPPTLLALTSLAPLADLILFVVCAREVAAPSPHRATAGLT